jgi:PAS domain S-box-containing protein
MKEIVSVKLENEMDIILAHKRAMKLAELCGCSLVTQTTVATAVSEISRCGLEEGGSSMLTLAVESTPARKYITAMVRIPSAIISNKVRELLTYAKRLVEDLKITTSPKESKITLRYPLAFGGTITDQRVISFRVYFEKEPPLSPYDELRRKNQLLQDLAEKIKETESEYKVLSDTLPLMMFSANNRAQITFTNKWFQEFFGTVPKELNVASWQPYVHEPDFSAFSKELNSSVLKQCAMSTQLRLKHKPTGTSLWHMFSIIPMRNEKELVTGWIGFLVDIHAQKLIEQTLKDNRELKDTQNQLFRYQDELERKVIELNRSNYELEQFAHLASHDLQEPLRKLFFYSDLLRKKYSHAIDDNGMAILNTMTNAASRMRELIQDLLSYSRLHKQTLIMEQVNLQEVMEEILRDLEVNIREKNAVVRIAGLPVVRGNRLRLIQLFTNLISNSLKYSRKDTPPVVEIAASTSDDELVISVRDNGIGFDPQYSEKIFGLFERLHSRDQFPGTGIGLSICKKIAELHGGTIKASSKENEYSVFDVYLPLRQEALTPVAQQQS